MTAKVEPRNAPDALARTRALVEPALRIALGRLDDERMRLIAGYQLGLCDDEGRPGSFGGKAIRPALVLLAAEAVSGTPDAGIPGAVAVEFVHNFSLLHDDIMDRDVTRRHRPTGWVVFGEGQAILAGNAMLTAAIETLVQDDPRADRTLPELLSTVQHLIRGQSADLALEDDDTADIADMLAMEEGKTAALISGALAIGAMAAGAPQQVVDRLGEAGRLLGLAFQLVDDVLGVVGDSTVTGKSSSSDVRAHKRSAPVVAALRSGTPEGARLAAVLRDAPPESDDDVAEVVRLIEQAGGVRWATEEAERLLAQAVVHLSQDGLAHRRAVGDLTELAEYLVRRDR